jgi:hypothetical protein
VEPELQPCGEVIVVDGSAHYSELQQKTGRRIEMNVAVYVNPKRNVELIDKLKELGFPNSAFAIIHHSQEWQTPNTMESHRAYCLGISEFRTSTNARVQQRLELIYNAYVNGGFKSGKPEIFEALARAAVIDVPFE